LKGGKGNGQGRQEGKGRKRERERNSSFSSLHFKGGEKGKRGGSFLFSNRNRKRNETKIKDIREGEGRNS